jgi:DNA polymerase-1
VNPKSTPKRLVLLDAHAILHRAYHALPEFSSSKGEPTGALYGLSAMLIKIIADLKPDYLIAAYDLPKPTYRHEAFKDYKAGRAKADPELVSQMRRSRDVFTAFNIPIYDKEGFEADDIIGTIVEKLTAKSQKLKADVDIVIASGDMDTLQLVSDDKVRVYTLKKGIKDTIIYNEKGVIERFGFGPELLPDYKGLRGDPSDNIPGIKGIGEKTATILITNFGSVEQIYKQIKKDEKPLLKAGITPRIVELLKTNEEEAQFSKMLGTIRRDAPIDFRLPEQTWKESLDVTKTEELFSELEFRALGTRFKETLNKEAPNSKTQVPNKSQIIKSENSETTHYSLPTTHLPSDFFETSLALWVVNSNLTNPTMEDVLNFGRTDDYEKAKKLIFETLRQRKSERVYEEIEKPLIPVVKAMDERGVKIDTELLKKLSVEYHKKLDGLEKEIHQLAGEEFNVASPKQLGEILFVKMGLAGKRQKKTATGAFSTKESELEKLRESHPIISLILEYREFAKLLSTYIDTIPTLVDKNNRLHTHFLQAGAATGRMASENPGLQNIPNKTELGRAIRQAFVAEKGFKLLALDYSQIELRIAAFLSGDKKLIEIFKNGEDVHTAVAAEVFGVPGDKVHKDMRRKAKVINFGVMYGMGVNALRTNLGAGTTREEAQKFYNDYFEKFSGLAKYLDKVKAETARQGYTETFFGRRRYFEGINSKLPFIRAAAERMAINAPIQGTEADIVKLAMIKICEYIKSEKLEEQVFPILQVHDELVYEVREDLISKIAPAIKKIMESVIPPEKVAGIVCVAEASEGERWGEMKKVEGI